MTNRRSAALGGHIRDESLTATGPKMGKGADTRIVGPFQTPSQGDNPNIALTRPQSTRPLTLVGECLAVLLTRRDT